MSSTLKLRWEWPATREKESSCRARITNISSSKKLFDSPSFAQYMPDPFIIEAEVLNGINFPFIWLELPYLEIANFQMGDLVELELIGDSVCTAIRKFE